MGNVGLGYY
jgi:hypothetical protein